MCVLCLLKLNVILSLLVAAMVAGLTAGLDLDVIMGFVIDGLNGNGTNALAYLLLGTFAAALTDTGLATLLGKWIASVVKERKWVLLITFLLCACISGTLVPIHIAYIPILYPPLLPASPSVAWSPCTSPSPSPTVPFSRASSPTT